MMPKLAICIPTYNMANYLDETLESICREINNQNLQQVEICISDNCSSDKTAEVIESYKERFTNIAYKRQLENIGPDRNFLAAIELAESEFCWLFGSDDAIIPGSISKVLEELSRGGDLILANRINCDKDLKPVSHDFWLKHQYPSYSFNSADEKELKKYLKQAQSIGALFSFMSVNIFRKSLWDSVPVTNELLNTSYLHVVKLMEIFDRGCQFSYMRDQLVYCRGDNDSFLQSKWQRLMLDFTSYDRIIRATVRKSHWPFFYATMRQEHPFYRIVRLRSLAPSSKEWQKASSLLEHFGYSPFQIYSAFLCGSFSWLINHAVTTRDFITHKLKNSH